MSERGSFIERSDIERRPELDPSRKVEILKNHLIEVIDVISVNSSLRKYVKKRQYFESFESEKALEYAKKHAKNERIKSDSSYLGTVVQHEDFRSLE